MIDTILFDLDDTLLGNDMQIFIPRYFALLGEHARDLMARDAFIQALLASTGAMVRNGDTAVSNRDAFWQDFNRRTGLDPQTLEPFFEQFYQTAFHRLAEVTQPRPFVPDLLRACFAQGLQVVIATNPLFPRTAIEARLIWAGVPVSDYPYALVTTYENMHAAKPHPAYYREILAKVGADPANAIMVGDDWRNDIAPAAAVGLHTYWVCSPGAAPPDPRLATGSGALETFFHKLLVGWLAQIAAPA